MSVPVKCQQCGRSHRAPDDLIGKTFKCKRCGEGVPVPRDSSDRRDRTSRPKRQRAAARHSDSELPVVEVVDYPDSDPDPPPPPRRRRKRRQKSRKRKPQPAAFASDAALDFGGLDTQGEALGDGNLIECGECGDVYGDKCDECVHCGAPNQEKQTQVRERKRKKRKATEHEQGLVGEMAGAIGSFLSEYQVLAGALGLVAFVGFFVWFGSAFVMQNMKTNRGTRQQVEFRGKSTGAWLDLERVGKARRNESLWSTDNNKWLNLDNEIELDFAALPELFQALTHDKTKRLAETALGKNPTRKKVAHSWGPNETQVYTGPLMEDLEPGFKSTNPLILKWAAKMAGYWEGKKEDMYPFLEEIAKNEDPDASKAAGDAIEKLKKKEEDAEERAKARKAKREAKRKS